MLGERSPSAAVIALLLLGGTTLAAPGARARLRLAVDSSPEPVSNVLLSLGGNAVVVGAVWLALRHPVVALGAGLDGLVLAVLAVVWLGGRVRRALRARRRRVAARLPAGRGLSG